MSTNQGTSEAAVWVTQAGLPLRMELEWPYKKSVSGADFYVLHAKVTEPGSGLQALAAVQLTLTVAEVLPSLEPGDAAAPTINTLRKAVDDKELEFTAKPKRVPVPFNTRRWSLKFQRWEFGQADDAAVERLLARKVFWQAKVGAANERVRVADPVDAQYVNVATEQMIEAAKRLAGQGLIRLEGEWAMATPALMARAEEFERERKHAQEQLERKHAFERG